MKVKKLSHCKGLPFYATEGAAGLDLVAAIDDKILLNPGERVRVPTGIIIEVPEGFEGQLRPRSGLAIKHGISLANSIGTIDSDYRGEVCAILINHGKLPFTIDPGERIAQLVICPILKVRIEEVEELGETIRGSGGFGSTGRN
jgi:dUTP pyrophosphatase